MKRAPHLPAAVVEDQNAPVASVVPVKAKIVKVGDATLGYSHRPERKQGFWTRNTQRLAEVERLISYRAMMTARYGQVFETRDEDYLAAILPELLLEANLPRRPACRANAILWAAAFVPALLDHRGPDWFDELEWEVERAGRTPKPLRADAVAKLLRVTWEERKACELTTIGAVDMTKRQQRAEARKADAEYQKAKREREGAKPREQSLSKLKPWEAEGIKRSAWYARQKALRTNSSGTCDPENGPSWTNSSGTSQSGFEGSRTVSSGAIYNIGVTTDLSGSAEKRISHSDDGHVIGLPGEGNTRPARKTPDAISAWATISPAPQPSDSVQLSLLPFVQAEQELRAILHPWTEGEMPEAVRVAVIAAKRRRAVRQDDIADWVRISRPQLTNALQAARRRRLGLPNAFDLSPDVIERLKLWLLTPDADLPPPATSDQDRPARPNGRRCGSRQPGPGASFPALHILTLVEGQPRPAAERDLRVAA